MAKAPEHKPYPSPDYDMAYVAGFQASSSRIFSLTTAWSLLRAHNLVIAEEEGFLRHKPDMDLFRQPAFVSDRDLWPLLDWSDSLPLDDQMQWLVRDIIAMRHSSHVHPAVREQLTPLDLPTLLRTIPLPLARKSP